MVYHAAEGIINPEDSDEEISSQEEHINQEDNFNQVEDIKAEEDFTEGEDTKEDKNPQYAILSKKYSRPSLFNQECMPNNRQQC